MPPPESSKSGIIILFAWKNPSKSVIQIPIDNIGPLQENAISQQRICIYRLAFYQMMSVKDVLSLSIYTSLFRQHFSVYLKCIWHDTSQKSHVHEDLHHVVLRIICQNINAFQENEQWQCIRRVSENNVSNHEHQRMEEIPAEQAINLTNFAGQIWWNICLHNKHLWKPHCDAHGDTDDCWWIINYRLSLLSIFPS